MAARILRATAAVRTSIVRNRVIALDVSHSSGRLFHVSQAALKKKGKATQKSSAFDDSDDSDADELFSAATPAPKSQPEPIQLSKPAPLPRRRVSPSSETGLMDEKAAELLRQRENERRDAFQSNYEYLYGRTGDAGKQSKALPARRALHKLVELAISLEEWQRVIGILRQWRRYPARSVPLSIQQLFIERNISTGNAPLLVNILTHHPIYGIHVSSLPLARGLLKDVITPVNSYPPAYSSNTNYSDASAFRERLEQALRLAEVLSITPITSRAATSSNSSDPVFSPPAKSTLSPSTDLVMGSLLLSAILRVASLPPASTQSKDPQETNITPGIMADSTSLAHATLQLVNDLSSHHDPSHVPGASLQPPRSTPVPGVLSAKEAIWTVAALRECEVALGAKNVRKLFDERGEQVDGVELTFDEMVRWIKLAREKLIEGAGEVERGKVAREKMEAAAKEEGLKPRAGSVEASGKKGGREGKGAVGNHLPGREGAQSAERRL